jgi:hypothetical protein
VIRAVLIILLLAAVTPSDAPLRQSTEPFVENPRFCGSVCVRALTEC